jgi:hypothetical protein
MFGHMLGVQRIVFRKKTGFGAILQGGFRRGKE